MCLWPNAASQGRPPDGSGGESERSTQNGRAKTLCGGGGGGGGNNSELPQAGFPESGEVLVQPLALCAASKGSNREANHQPASRPLASHSNISAKVREAGTLPRSPRSNWRAAKPEAPILRPSSTDSMLVFAARARDHATLNRRLGLSARIGERWC